MASVASMAVVASSRPGTSPVAAASRPVPVTSARPTLRRPSAEDEAALLLGAGSPCEAAADCFGSASLGSARMGSLSSSLSRGARPRSSGTSPAAASVVGFAGAASPQGLKPAVPGGTKPKGPGMLRRELARETVLATPAADFASAPEAATRKTTAAERGARPDERTAATPSELEAASQARYDSLLVEAQEAHPVFRSSLVRKAFAVARSAHDGQLRKSGEPVLAHAVQTALILAQLGLDATVVAAGLLHDTLDDTMLYLAQLEALFPGTDVPLLVSGVSKMSGASQLHRDASDAGRQLPAPEVEALRSMLLAMADVRVVLIKLADRLHNLRTVGALPPATAARFAAETLDVFCPLANRLGVWSLKAELEDLCFAVLHSEAHAAVAGSLHSGAEAAGVAAARDALAAALEDAGVRALDLSGRPKNLYSLWRKMERKGMPLGDVHAVLDARALRVIVPDEAACYAALRAVHATWAPLAGKVKDYVREPKANGYRSLHTVVADAAGRPMEVQIRTPEMHAVAEYGVAAHWRYKEGHEGGSSGSEDDGEEDADTGLEHDASAARFLEAQVAWGRFLLSWVGDAAAGASELVAAAAFSSASCAASGCRFPTHAAACAHAAGWPLAHRAQPPPPATADGAPLFLMVRDAAAPDAAGTLRIVTLPRRATVGDLRDALGASALLQRRVLVNAEVPRDDISATSPAGAPLHLASGDLLELLPAEAPAKRGGLAAERERLMRLVGLRLSGATSAADFDGGLDARLELSAPA